MKGKKQQIGEALTERQSFSLEEAFEFTSGKGYFTVYLIVLMSMNYSVGSFLLYNLGFLIKPQRYECEVGPDFEECTKRKICNNDIVYRVDRSPNDYLYNWYAEMNLVCTPVWEISILGAAYYMSYAVGCSLLNAPETQGRRKSLFFTNVFFMVGYAIALFSEQLGVKIVGLMLMGVMHMKSSIAMALLFELLPQAKKSAGITFLGCYDSSTMFISCLVYYFLSNNYFHLQVYAFILACIVTTLATLTIPESPVYLINKGKYKDSCKIFNYIAAFNGSKNRISPNALIYIQQQPQQVEPSVVDIEYTMIKKEARHNGFVATLTSRTGLIRQILFLFAIRIGIVLIYFLILFYFVKLPGNSFINGMIMGFSLIASCLTAGALLSKFPNLSVFRAYLFLAMIGVAGLSIVTDQQAVLLLILVAVLGIGGANNTFFLVIEQRTPSEIQVGTMEISGSLSQLFVTLAPNIAMMRAPMPMAISTGVALGTLLITFSVTTPPDTVPVECLEENYDEHELKLPGQSTMYDATHLSQTNIDGMSFFNRA